MRKKKFKIKREYKGRNGKKCLIGCTRIRRRINLYKSEQRDEGATEKYTLNAKKCTTRQILSYKMTKP
jgi:hypothetical protein